jgi:outer membrane protein OmpA-like peptidoglycan-associated protein
VQFLHFKQYPVKSQAQSMRKLFLALSTIFILSGTLNAQLRVAITGGPHQSKVIETNNLSNWDSIGKNNDSRTGAHFGFIADLPFGPRANFSFQPAVLFYNKGRNYLGNYDSTVKVRSNPTDSFAVKRYIERGKQYINYIEVPLNLVAKLKLGKNFKFILGGGPYVSFFFKGFEDKEKRIVDFNFSKEKNENLLVGDGVGKYTLMDYGINGLAGFEIGRVMLTANYSRGLKDFYKPSVYTGSLKHEVMGVSLGIFLGRQIAIEKKTKDRDKDGIADEKDECPDEAGTIINKGCPDKDADGIADKNDKCPEQPGTVANNGCPAAVVTDKDKDGVNDPEDKCPDVAGSKKYNGCPVPDTDKDGINDEDDKCPDVIGYGRFEGCPVPDRDNDGINDDEDKCPETAGAKERNGCPEIKKEIIEKVNYAARRIQFAFGKADLVPASFTVLDNVVTILKDNPSLTLAIEGHTSRDGSLAVNMKLSQSRADNVKAYIVSKGIDAARLTAKGFGPAKPINSEKTEAEKAQNRRVELIPGNQ